MTLMTIITKMAVGLEKTCAIFFLTLLFAIPLGMIVALLRGSKIKIVSWIAKAYISVLRGTPLMLQLIAVTYGPYYLFGISISRNKLIPVVIAFAINYAAYFAEIYRSGIEAVPKGQYEAAKVLGYSRQQTFMKIVFPQMVRHTLPPVTNEIITLVKDTSLAYAIAYVEMFTLAKQVAAAQSSIMALFVAGAFYYIFNLLVAYVMGRIEKKMNYYAK